MELIPYNDCKVSSSSFFNTRAIGGNIKNHLHNSKPSKLLLSGAVSFCGCLEKGKAPIYRISLVPIGFPQFSQRLHALNNIIRKCLVMTTVKDRSGNRRAYLDCSRIFFLSSFSSDERNLLELVGLKALQGSERMNQEIMIIYFLPPRTFRRGPNSPYFLSRSDFPLPLV